MEKLPQQRVHIRVLTHVDFPQIENHCDEGDDGHRSFNDDGAESDHEPKESWADTTQEGELESRLSELQGK